MCVGVSHRQITSLEGKISRAFREPDSFTDSRWAPMAGREAEGQGRGLGRATSASPLLDTWGALAAPALDPRAADACKSGCQAPRVGVQRPLFRSEERAGGALANLAHQAWV